MADITHVQKGEMLRNEDRLSIEHFGYIDGISQPKFLKGETAPGSAWNDNMNLGAVLVEEKIEGYTNCFGSFFVFRKLEQNVKLFNQKVNALAGMLSAGNNSPDAVKLAAAYVIGRFKNGTPVTKHPKELSIHKEEELDNDFNFNNDKQGLKCPFHAHIRAVAPRDIDPCYDFNRIVRRGIPYDEAGRNGDMSWFPEGNVGLLFMCYQLDIRRYFEKLQLEWASQGKIGRRKIPMDGIIGQGDSNDLPQTWPAHWDGPDTMDGFRFSDTVILKGGEYFFAPSIPFLLRMKPSDPRQ
jgi:Dyp-type peroxidase family